MPSTKNPAPAPGPGAASQGKPAAARKAAGKTLAAARPAAAPSAVTGSSPLKTPRRASAKTVAPPLKAPVATKQAKTTPPAKPVKAAKPAKAPKHAKPAKPAKVAKPPKLRQKPVRDSFTMPEADFALIATLKARTLAAQRETKKSELLRAGLHALAAMDTAALVAALGDLEPVKIGRPKLAQDS